MDSEMVKLQYKEYDYTIKFLKILAKFNCWYRIDLTEIGSSFVFSLSFERLMVCFLFLSDKTNISPDKRTNFNSEIFLHRNVQFLKDLCIN